MAAGYVKLRRGLLEHLPRMTPNAVKLYVYLLLKVRGTGVDKGLYRSTSRAMAGELAMNRLAVMSATRELESMKPKAFIKVKRSTNQHSLTEYRILRFAGSELTPAEAGGGTEDEPAPVPAAIPADPPKQIVINGLAAPKTYKTEENSREALFRRGSDGSYPAWFERFWGSYPSTKGAKKTAFEKVRKVVKCDRDIELALEYLGIRAQHIAAMKANGKFVESLPHVERYFSRGLWNQEPESPADNGDEIRMAWQ